ncbi:hypothetical protein PSMA108079_06480 [Pseudoalteromonas mariniglutinosa]|nr:hypothetical protein [Pseudoalteromonas mariniglutinosa]
MQAMVKQLDEVTPQIDQGVKNAAQEIGNRVNKALDEFEPPVNTGVVGKPKKTVANELEAPEGNDLKGAKSKESKQISNSLLIEKYANEFSTLSRKDFRTWKIKLANEGLSSSEIQDAIYFGSLKSGKNMWGDNWKKYYEEISGTKYPGPPNHAHHLVEKKGGGKYGVANRKILEDVGINPLLSRENFAWAPNIKGQHGLEPQAQLNEMLNTSQGNKKAILKVLEQWATISKGRTI